MADINICTFTGRLGADPEVKSFQNGGRIANMRIAVGQSWKDKSTGERKERTEWVSVAITADGLIGVAERYLRKGSRVAISGEFRTRKWQDQSGNDRYTSEIVIGSFGGTLVMLDAAKDGDGQGGARQPEQRSSGNARGNGGGWSGGSADGGSRGSGGWADDLDDEIPF